MPVLWKEYWFAQMGVIMSCSIKMFSGGHEQIGIIDHKVGDTVYEIFHCGGVVNVNTEPCKGTVVYVHPCGRFYTVEFDFGGMKLRESYTVRSDVNPTRLSWF